MLVVADVALRLEPIRRTAALADVHLVADLPVADARTALAVMLHQARDEFLPCRVIRRLHDAIVDFGKKYARFEAQAHQRFRAGLEDAVHHPVERVEMISTPLRQQVVDSCTNSRMMPG